MSNEFEYLSDEELLRLIDYAEDDGLLSAPHDLKENVLTEIPRLEVRQANRKNAKTQFYRYCARVALGCAASLAILVSSGPVSQLVKDAPKPETSISQQVNQLSFNLSNALDRVSNAIANYQFGNSEGNRNE